MRAELYRPDEPGSVVAVALWSANGSAVEAVDGEVDGIERLLRPVAVVVSDPSLLPQGAHGEALLQPDSLEWFRAALLTRAPELGLSVRFVVDDARNGWDPAANYRRFRDQIRRIVGS